MTISDCSRASGISPGTIRKAIAETDLEASRTGRGRWYILPMALYDWSLRKWAEGRCSMYPAYWIAGYLVLFHGHELTETLRYILEAEHERRRE